MIAPPVELADNVLLRGATLTLDPRTRRYFHAIAADVDEVARMPAAADGSSKQEIDG